MIGIFKANNPFNTFLLFVYGLLLKLAWFWYPHIPVVHTTDGFLYKEILSKLENTGAHLPVIYPVITSNIRMKLQLILKHGLKVFRFTFPRMSKTMKIFN